jgi:hypothetical protein
MDVLAITGIITGVTGLVVAVLSHVKYSNCCGWYVETRTIPKLDNLQPPIEKAPTESTFLFQT